MEQYCIFDKCDRMAKTRGYCTNHYKQKWKLMEMGNTKVCKIDDCNYGASSHGYCSDHYSANVRNGVIQYEKKCSVDDCKGNHSARGYCKKHYNERARAGEFKDLKRCNIVECDGIHQAKGYCEKHYAILKTYNIIPEHYELMLSEQNNLCAICNKLPPGTHKKTSVLFVDHNHATGNVRGLLCHYCNSMLGHAYDNVNIFKSAIKYLEENNE